MSRPDIPVTISGNSKDLESTLSRIRARAGTTADAVTNSFMAIKSRVGSITGFVAAAGITAAIGAVRDAASAIAEIGVEARKAGVDVKSFQELKFVALQNKVGVDALTDGLKELSLRADEFIVTGGGSAAEAFQRLGFSAQMLKEKLKDPSNLFTEIIGKLDQLDKAAQIRILDEIFGGAGGEQFLQIVRLGEKGIRDTIKAAHDLGAVYDAEMIQKGEEIDKKFNTIATTVGRKLKGAVIEAADALNQFLGLFEQVDQRATRHLSDQLGLAQRQLDAAQKGKDRMPSFMQAPFDKQIVASRAEVDRLTAELAGRNTIVSPGASPKGGRVLSATDIMRGKLIDEKVKNAFDSSGSSSKENSRGGAAKAAKEEEAAYIGVIKALREELEVIGMTDVEREKTVSLREAGVTAASQEGQQISLLIEQKHRELDAEEALTTERERAQEVAQNLGDTLDDQMSRIIDGTFDARDAVAALVMELINASTNGKGLFGSLFSALAGGLSSGTGPKFASNTSPNLLSFGGARAGGGDVSPGRIYRVNEYEEEFFSPGSHGRVIAPSKTRGNGQSAGVSERSVVEIVLSPELKAAILWEAQGQSIEIVRQSNVAQQTYKQNGGK